MKNLAQGLVEGVEKWRVGEGAGWNSKNGGVEGIGREVDDECGNGKNEEKGGSFWMVKVWTYMFPIPSSTSFAVHFG